MSRSSRIRTLDRKIKAHEHAAWMSDIPGDTAEHRAMVSKLKADRKQLMLYRSGVLYPLDVAWSWLREHPILAIIIALSPVMIMGGPAAIAGFFMIVMTLAVLGFLLKSLFKHWKAKDAQPRATKDSGVFTVVDLPGGQLRLPGLVPVDVTSEIRKRFDRAVTNRSTFVIPQDSTYQIDPNRRGQQPLSILTAGPSARQLGESVSAMHPDAVEEFEPLHPELPAWMRQVWIKAIVDYRNRVTLEGRRYWNLKWQWRELTDAVQWDWSPSAPGKLAAHLRSDSIPNTLQYDALRLAGQFDTISDEGAMYGEQLVRSNYARAGYARQSGCDQAVSEVGVPEMPRDFVPILDRDFQLTTDCRYHHVADHAIVEQTTSSAHVLRCCTVCEPPTYWLERA